MMRGLGFQEYREVATAFMEKHLKYQVYKSTNSTHWTSRPVIVQGLKDCWNGVCHVNGRPPSGSTQVLLGQQGTAVAARNPASCNSYQVDATSERSILCSFKIPLTELTPPTGHKADTTGGDLDKGK
jgi:hypothetical protein